MTAHPTVSLTTQLRNNSRYFSFRPGRDGSYLQFFSTLVMVPDRLRHDEGYRRRTGSGTAGESDRSAGVKWALPKA